MSKEVALVLGIAASTLCAAEDSAAPSPCCQNPDPCVSCAQLWPSKGPNWIITPNAGPCVRDGADAYLTGEFLYWTAHQDHLGFIVTSSIESGGSTLSTSAGAIYHPDWKMEPGFRIGLGMIFDHDGWDIYANYTWLKYSDIHRSVHASDGTRLMKDYIWYFDGATAGGSTVTPLLQFSDAGWNLHLNILDLCLGRNFFVSRYLQMRPSFGLKAVWMTQEFAGALQGIGQSASVFDFISYSANKMNNWGIGLRAGIDTSWHFTKSFSAVGNAAITSLWEQFKVFRRDFTHNLTANTYSSTLDFKNNFHTIKPIIEIYLGLRWESWYNCEAYHISLEAGWEEQFWGSQNQFAQIVMESRLGDLVLQGLTCKVRFDF